jgi:hypothetical protein
MTRLRDASNVVRVDIAQQEDTPMKSFFWLLAVSALAIILPVKPHEAQGQNSPFVEGVPQCVQAIYENGDLVMANGCSSPVYVVWASDGDVWGGAHLSGGGKSNTGQSRNAVSRAGGVRMFTCPGDATPEDPQGRPVGSHYNGQYRCRR